MENGDDGAIAFLRVREEREEDFVPSQIKVNPLNLLMHNTYVSGLSKELEFDGAVTDINGETFWWRNLVKDSKAVKQEWGIGLLLMVPLST